MLGVIPPEIMVPDKGAPALTHPGHERRADVVPTGGPWGESAASGLRWGRDERVR